jgi:phosphoglycolate phosphatase
MSEQVLADVEAILFDFEGTLVDFQWKLAEAVEEVLQMLEKLGFARDRIQSRKYSTLLPEVLRMAPDLGLQAAEVREKVFTVYDRFDADALTRWTPRPGVRDFLDAAKKRRIHCGLVSNVGSRTLSRALLKLGLQGFFEIALSRNDVANLKPSPDGINLALEKLGAKKEKSIFIGDSLDDVHGAKNAGLRVIIISEGENLREELLAARPDYLIRGYDELLLFL